MKEERDSKVFHYVKLKDLQTVSIFSEEWVKKKFLDQIRLLKVQLSFQVYCYCLTNTEAHFLICLSENTDIDSVISDMKMYLTKVSEQGFSKNPDDIQGGYRITAIEDDEDLIELIVKIHSVGLVCANEIQDHWWSSYIEYAKGYPGIAQTDLVLKRLNQNLRRASQKFIAYHKKPYN